MVGETVGKYKVLERIGRGGMGTVYRAMDENLHRDVAIKVLNAELNDPEVAKRFRAEAVTVARLNHPGIATIYELFQHDGQWLMVMEFVRGETLERLVDRMGALSPTKAAELCMQVLTALAHAHSMGVIHRDLKPANLMSTEAGAVKIMDFGIARVSGSEHLTSAGFMMGTPAYMAPEQVLGHEIDARADLYSMGVVFYRLTTGKLPFKGDTPFAMAQSQVNDPPTPIGMLRSDLPPWAEQITSRALAKPPEQRFQSAVEFYEAFSRCLAGLPLTTPSGATAQTEMLRAPDRTGTTGSTPHLPPAFGSETAARMAVPTAPKPESSESPASSAPAAAPIAAASSAAAASSDAVKPAVSAPVPKSDPKPAPPAKPGAADAKKPAAAASAAPKTSTTPAKKSSSGALIAIAAVVLIGIGVGAFLWQRHRQTTANEAAAAAALAPSAPDAAPTDSSAASAAATTPPAAPTTPPATTTPAPDAADAGRAGTPASPTTPAATNAGAANATTGTTANGRAGTRGATPPGGTSTPAAGTSPSANPAGASTSTPATPVAGDDHLAFNDVKLLSVNGTKASDQDVLLTFVAGQVSVLPKNGGAPLDAIPYKNVVRATYTHAKIRNGTPR